MSEPEVSVAVEPAIVSDEMLAQRLAGGDTAAGEALVKRYFPILMRYLQRIAGEHLAEELHQLTWVSVLDHINRFDTGSAGGGFKAWIFCIATNKANDLWRSRGREKVAKDGLRLVSEDQYPHAGHHLEGVEQTQKLQQALMQLPEKQRQVLMLRYYSDMKFADIAAMLGCPLNTALGRVHKAMIRLRQIMGDT